MVRDVPHLRMERKRTATRQHAPSPPETDLQTLECRVREERDAFQVACDARWPSTHSQALSKELPESHRALVTHHYAEHRRNNEEPNEAGLPYCADPTSTWTAA
jgi:hypothetical protein